MKQLNDLKSWDVKRIDAMFEQHGMGRKGIDIVSRSFSISESAAEAMATAIKDRNAPKKAVTESAPDLTAAGTTTDPGASRKTDLALRLVQQVQAAEAKPLAECSIQELQALAAAAGAEAGMFA